MSPNEVSHPQVNNVETHGLTLPLRSTARPSRRFSVRPDGRTGRIQQQAGRMGRRWLLIHAGCESPWRTWLSIVDAVIHIGSGSIRQTLELESMVDVGIHRGVGCPLGIRESILDLGLGVYDRLWNPCWTWKSITVDVAVLVHS